MTNISTPMEVQLNSNLPSQFPDIQSPLADDSRKVSLNETNSLTTSNIVHTKPRRRLVRKLKSRKKYRSGATRKRKTFKLNKMSDAMPKLHSQIPLHSSKKNRHIYENHGNREVYYRIYNSK